MPLSEYEQQVLAQMEQALRSDDPGLASSLRGPKAPRPIYRWIAGAAIVIAGLLMLVIAVSIPATWLGVVGFIVMFAGVLWASATPKSRGVAGVVQGDGTVKPRSRGGAGPKHASFMSRLEDRWERRRQSGL